MKKLILFLCFSFFVCFAVNSEIIAQINGPGGTAGIENSDYDCCVPAGSFIDGNRLRSDCAGGRDSQCCGWQCDSDTGEGVSGPAIEDQ